MPSMTEQNENGSPRRIEIEQTRLLYIIWTVIFGVALGLGGSLFSMTLPPDPITRALIIGPFVALMLGLNKMVLLRPLSVTLMLAIASLIGVFTFYLGPPNPYKPLFVLAGFAFDLGTFFRTTSLRYWNIALGYIAYTLVAALVFLLTLYLIDPKIVPPVQKLLYYAVLLFWVIALPLAAILWRILRPPGSPSVVRSIRCQVGSPVEG